MAGKHHHKLTACINTRFTLAEKKCMVNVGKHFINGPSQRIFWVEILGYIKTPTIGLMTIWK